jgi:hypothetical protein
VNRKEKFYVICKRFFKESKKKRNKGRKKRLQIFFLHWIFSSPEKRVRMDDIIDIPLEKRQELKVKEFSCPCKKPTFNVKIVKCPRCRKGKKCPKRNKKKVIIIRNCCPIPECPPFSSCSVSSPNTGFSILPIMEGEILL